MGHTIQINKTVGKCISSPPDSEIHRLKLEEIITQHTELIIF